MKKTQTDGSAGSSITVKYSSSIAKRELHINFKILLLPPTSEGWGKVLFSVCQSTSRGRVGYPSQVWRGVNPIPGLGREGDTWVPPNQVWMGYPPQTWDRVPPRPGTGYPPDLGWVTPPQTWDGVPPGPEMEYSPQTWDGVPPLTWGIASTCYAKGSMPLAFTQEDFLVSSLFAHNFTWNKV